jgi:peptidoglycan L-alanyl-D-glutamate endopeptidase CwlK
MSRSLDDLHPIVREKAEQWLELCNQAGHEPLVTCTYRSVQEQDDLYAQGRSKPGKRVTNVRGGNSYHNWRVAIDFVPLLAGKPVWDAEHKAWPEIATLAEAVGFEWGGRWTTFKDLPHLQYTQGLTCDDFRNGKTLS